MSSDDGNFLARWSRRKVEARRTVSEAAPDASPEPLPAAPPQPAPGKPVDQDAAKLPSLDELRGVESDYREFLRPEVDESLRRRALRKLFHDPHFNVMDGLDTYIDDYTKADPIPEAMLRGLNQAQGLLFDRDEADAEGEPQPASTHSEEAPRENTKPDASPAGQSEAPGTPPAAPIPPESAESA